jgi:hypothetical protein
MMSNYYNNFFRNHERLFRDFERDFGRDSMLPSTGGIFHQDLPMLSWTDDDFFMPSQQRTGSTQIDSSLQNLNSQFEADYKKLRQNYEQQLWQIHGQNRLTNQSTTQSTNQQQAAGESQQQQQQHPATGGTMEVEQGSRQQKHQHQHHMPKNDAYEYYFTSTRNYKDGKETGETVEKKEKIVDGKKILETKITKYNPDGTKDVQRITEDENGKKESKLRLDSKDQPLQLE